MSPTPPEQELDSIRSLQRQYWSELAEDWKTFDPALEPLTARLLELAHVVPGSRLVDLACGTGMPALRAAEIVGPEGFVLGLDISDTLISIAQNEAKLRKLGNASFRVISSETELGLTASSFSAATCKHGLMWMPEPVAAAEALGDALEVGGRIAVSSWQRMEEHPVLSLPVRLTGQYLDLSGYESPSPPSPLHSHEALRQVLERAGFQQVESEELVVKQVLASGVEEFLEEYLWGDPQLETVMRAAPAHVVRHVESQVSAAVQDAVGTGPVELPLIMLLASAVKL